MAVLVAVMTVLLHGSGGQSTAILIIVAGGFVAGFIARSWLAAIIPVLATVGTMVWVMLTDYPWGPDGRIHIDILLLGVVFGTLGVPAALGGAALGKLLRVRLSRVRLPPDDPEAG